MMTVKITLERKFKVDPFPDGLQAINALKVKTMQQKGYVSAETLVNIEDNREVVELSVWSSLEDWKTWVNSQERSKLENRLTPRLKEPAKIRCYMLGADGMANAFKNFFQGSEVAFNPDYEKDAILH
jgi:heme-degrading monooxygenase HmoA